MAGVGIVADDLTGATTVGALIAREGAAATVLFDLAALAQQTVEQNTAVIVSTDSRSMEPEVAFHRVRRATTALQRSGASLYSKRIDTTSRGGIGPEIEGMLDALGPDYCAFVVPAMPQSRRIVVGGYSLIDSVLLSRTDVARDVRTPVTESHLPTLLAGQLTLDSTHIGLDVVLQGPEAVQRQMDDLRDHGVRVIIIDAASLEDVDVVAQAAAASQRPFICVDPGPFTTRTAIRSGVLHPETPPSRDTRLESLQGETGTVVVIAGSATTVTHTQVQQLCQVEGTEAVGAGVLEIIGTDEVFEAECTHVVGQVSRLLHQPRRPRVLVVALETVFTGGRTPQADMEAASGLRGQQVSTMLTSRFGTLARRVLEELGKDDCAGLYLTGGDVMVSCCRAFDARGITLIDYVIPQVDQGLLVGGPFEGLPVVCKGGLTGDQTTAIRCVNRIFDERMEKTHE